MHAEHCYKLFTVVSGMCFRPETEEALYRTMWRGRFRRGFGPVV